MIFAVSGFTMHLLPLLAALAVMTGAGSLLARWLQTPKLAIAPRQSLSLASARSAWGWRYLLGVALVGILLQLPLLVDQKITHRSYLGAIALCAAMTIAEVVLRWRERRQALAAKQPRQGRLGWIGQLSPLPRVLVVLCLAIFAWFAMVESPITFDARAIYGRKARILYDTGDLHSEDFHDPDQLHFHPDYPLLIPLVEATLDFVQGSQQDLGMQLLFAGFVLAIASILVEEIRRFEPPDRAAMWGAAFLLLPYSIMPNEGAGLSGSVDYALAAFVTAGLIAAGRWLAAPHPRTAILAGLMLGAAALIKQEGTIWAVVSAGTWFVIMLSQRIRPLLPRFLAAAGMLGAAFGCVLIALVNRRGISPSPYMRTFSEAMHWEWIVQTLTRLPFIAKFAAKELVSTKTFEFVVPFVAAALLLLSRSRPPATVVFWRAVVLLIALVYLAILMITPLHLEYQLRTAFSRLTVHILPLFLLIGAEQLAASGWSRQLQWIFTGKSSDPAPSVHIEHSDDQAGGEQTEATPPLAPPLPNQRKSIRRAA
ncbi:MAG TPA: hypothetical protein VMJ32_03590 [Pirellulales bacterium]|nr:hypothetical protein [Pirellulales bacterium]